MESASSFSVLVDKTFLLILGTSVLMLLAITAIMILFVIKYSRKRNPNPAQIEGSAILETIWTVIPTAMVLVMFFSGWAGFKVMRDIPEGAMEVTVYGRKWSWLFEYENSVQSDVLVVPINQNVKLNLVSTDVIHSFYVPAFRLKEDCVPGYDNEAWFKAIEEGEYNLFCAEYCGDQHSKMITKVKVVDSEAYTNWLVEQDNKPISLDLLTLNGCTACHTLDGSRLVGPTFKGLFGRTETVLTNGEPRQITVDEEYIRKSIKEPMADITEGYPSAMVVQPNITDEDIENMIELLKDLK
jgi:cytochrome c oxidase subunit 2